MTKAENVVVVSRLLRQVKQRIAQYRRQADIKAYLKGGKKPWSRGYSLSKFDFIKTVLNDDVLITKFRYLDILPKGYGYGYDERVVEYPWVLSRLREGKSRLLDAGSVFNFLEIIETPKLYGKDITIFTLAPERRAFWEKGISYHYGDLREMPFKDGWFDEIVSISTLEHVGMNNTLLYSKDTRFNEFKPNDYLDVVREFRRLLKPGGRLFITVPYGRYENHGWLQQFDHKMVEAVFDAFGLSSHSATYYKYLPDGWQIAKAEECNGCSYFDIHNKQDYEPDYVAAARAVACVEMVK